MIDIMAPKTLHKNMFTSIWSDIYPSKKDTTSTGIYIWYTIYIGDIYPCQKYAISTGIYIWYAKQIWIYIAYQTYIHVRSMQLLLELYIKYILHMIRHVFIRSMQLGQMCNFVNSAAFPDDQSQRVHQTYLEMLLTYNCL